MKKILVVCHGNINRSPLCAAILKQRTGAEILQAAMMDWVRPLRAAKKMRDAAADLGLDLEEHRSQAATVEMLEEADMVIYMDGGNLKRLKTLAGTDTVDPKWHCLGQYAPGGSLPRIPDPGFMARDSAKFKETVNLIAKSSANLAEVIAKSCKKRQDE